MSIFMMKICSNVPLKCLRLIILLVLLCSINVVASKPKIPIAKNGIDISTVKYKNVAITCEADEPIHWIDVLDTFKSLPTAPFAWNFVESNIHMNAGKFIKGKFNIDYVNNSNDSTDPNPFKATLKLFDVNYKFVGYYFCATNSSKFSKPNVLYKHHPNVTKFYLSVADNDNPIYISTPFLFVHDNCPFDIPCKASNLTNEIDVTLNGEKVWRDTNSPHIIYKVSTAKYKLNRDSVNKVVCSINGTNEQVIDIYFHDQNSNVCDNRVKIESKTENFLIEGSTLEFDCISDTSNPEIEWELPSSQIKNRTETDIERLTVRNVNKTTDIGTYKCRVDETDEATLNITEILKPNESIITLSTHPMFSSIIFWNKSENLYLVVEYKYITALENTTLNINWYDNTNERIEWTKSNNDKERIIAFNDSVKNISVLIINDLRFLDSGKYKLIADNGVERQQKTFRLVVIDSKMLVWLAPCIFTIIVLLSTVIYQIYRSFSLNGRLVIGKEIGKGQFSVVHIGELSPLLPFQKSIKVVVKWTGTNEMAREWSALRNLSENSGIVKILGFTGDPLTGEMKIIYEFCPYGDMGNFLEENRNFFVNQVICQGDKYKIEYEKTTPDPPNPSGSSNPLGSSSPSGSSDLPNPENTNNSENRQNNRTGDYRDKTTKKQDEKKSILTPTEKKFSTINLYRWLYQIVDALSFLASKGIVHGDVAARNIFIDPDFNAKLGDFGLSLKLSEIYKKITSSPGFDPVPWMAIEIHPDKPAEDRKEYPDEMCDVWSFGVVIYEFFTLGEDPREISIENLERGVRLEQPEYATQKIYNVYLDDCCANDPNDRLKFHDLKEKMLNFYLNAMEGIDDGKKLQTEQNIEDGTGFHSIQTTGTRDDNSTNDLPLEKLPFGHLSPSTNVVGNGFGDVTSLIKNNSPNISDPSEEDTYL